MTKNRTPTPVYLDPGMHSGLEVKGLNVFFCGNWQQPNARAGQSKTYVLLVIRGFNLMRSLILDREKHKWPKCNYMLGNYYNKGFMNQQVPLAGLAWSLDTGVDGGSSALSINILHHFPTYPC